MRNDFYDREGRRITAEQFSRLVQAGQAVVADSQIGPVHIQTLLTGDDRSPWRGSEAGGRRPLIFETTLYAESGEPVARRWYATEDEARAGHAEWVAERGGQPPGSTGQPAARPRRIIDADLPD